MHGIYFGYLNSLFFRFWLFLSCESPEICCIDRREAEFHVPRQQVSNFLQLLKIDRGRLGVIQNLSKFKVNALSTYCCRFGPTNLL